MRNFFSPAVILDGIGLSKYADDAGRFATWVRTSQEKKAPKKNAYSMTDTLIYILLAIAAITAVLVIFLLIQQFSSNKSYRSSGETVAEQLRLGRTESLEAAKSLREELGMGLKASNDTVFNTLDGLGKTLLNQLEGMTSRVKTLEETNQAKVDEIRKENTEGLKTLNESVSQVLAELLRNQNEQLEAIRTQLKEQADSNQSTLDRIRNTFDERVRDLQEGNEKRLEEMRKTVDEKLHETLEQRLGASFKTVSEQLESVHKGLGEMQNLAVGVGDLKRVLSNVKVRGTWAEVQLGGILEQVLVRSQYEKNVCVNPASTERVEYAIKNPVSGSEHSSTLWLPIDSKFPQEDYLRVQEAAESGDPAQVQAAENALLKTIRNAAKEISSKYICPPHTTDYAIMFLATEGLHAEVLRQPALVDELLQNHRIFVAGPTTLAAILCSFRAGYQTLAIERRASEVWKVLGAIKTEFGRFGDVLAKVKTHLHRASNQIDQTGVRTRAMERHLRSVEEMPEIEATQVLNLPSPDFGDPKWNGYPEIAEIEEQAEEPSGLFANQDKDLF